MVVLDYLYKHKGTSVMFLILGLRYKFALYLHCYKTHLVHSIPIIVVHWIIFN